MNPSPPRILPVISYLFLCCVALLASCSKQDKQKTLPIAQNGILDLSQIDLSNTQQIQLDGEWTFFRNQDLNLKEIREGQFTDSDSIQVPALLTGQTYQKGKIKEKDRGTYWLKIVLPENWNKEITIGSTISYQMKLSIDGHEKIDSLNNPKEGWRFISPFYNHKPENNIVDLVISIKNDDLPKRLYGLTYSLMLYPDKELFESKKITSILIDFASAVIFLMLALYHLLLYFMRKKDTSTLSFFFVAMVFFGRIFTSSNIPSWALIGDYPDFYMKIEYIGITIAALAVLEFFKRALLCYKDNFLSKSYWFLSLLISMFIAFTPFRIFGEYLYLVQLHLVIGMIPCMYFFLKESLMGKKDAQIIAVGLAPLIFYVINESLRIHNMQLVDVNFISLAFASIIFSQASLIASKFIRAFHHVEENEKTILSLNENLNKLVDQKTASIQSMLDHLPQAIFTIDEKGEVLSDRSAHFDLVFKEGVHNVAQIMEFTDLNAAQKSMIHSVLESSIGSNQLAFQLNKHHLVRKLNLKADHMTKSIEIEWIPVVDRSGNITSMMVSARDVTELEEMKKKSEEQQKEIKILIELLENPIESIKRNLDILDDLAKDSIDATEDKSQEQYFRILRNIHTIKGNARMLNLSELSILCHEVEEKIKSLGDKSPVQLTKFLQEILSCNRSYKKVYNSRLASFNQEHGIFINTDDAKGILNTLQKNLQINDPNRGLITILENRLINSIEVVLAPVVSSIDRLALKLNIPRPKVIFEGEKTSIPQEKHSLLINVFNHLVRNSLDHGIERPSKRLESKKEEYGSLHIKAQSSKDSLQFIYFDDGRGLQLNKIKEKFKEKYPQKSPTLTNLIDVIFEPAFSTKEEVTDISGRGVGMDAIREYICEIGGNVEIVTENHTDDPEHIPNYLPFSIKITIPIANTT